MQPSINMFRYGINDNIKNGIRNNGIKIVIISPATENIPLRIPFFNPFTIPVEFRQYRYA